MPTITAGLDRQRFVFHARKHTEHLKQKVGSRQGCVATQIIWRRHLKQIIAIY